VFGGGSQATQIFGGGKGGGGQDEGQQGGYSLRSPLLSVGRDERGLM